jgi:hypothetical protein
MKTVIISLSSINQLIFVMETCCVFFEVWAEFLNTASFGFKELNINTVTNVLYLYMYKRLKSTLNVLMVRNTNYFYANVMQFWF